MNKFSLCLVFFSCVVSTIYSNTSTPELLVGMLELGTTTPENGFVPDKNALRNVSLLDRVFIIGECTRLLKSMKAYTGNNLEAINPMIDSTHEEIRDTINTLDRRYESNFLKNLKSPDKSHASRIRLLENVICGMTQVVGQQTIKAVQIFNMTIIFLVLGTTAFLKLLQMYLQYQAISNQHGNVQA